MTTDVKACDNAAGISFSELPLAPFLQQTIKTIGYNTPTPIQAQSIPLILEGRDLIGLAQTGTGKTAAFVLPILQRLSGSKENGVKALILAPTRELAEQINEVIKTFSGRAGVRSVTVYGGVSHRNQIAQLRSNAKIVVACPGRLMDHIRGKTIDLSSVEYLILDEADRMLDMGFMPDVRAIIKALPEKRQTMLFSATMPTEVAELSTSVLSNPTTVKVKSEQPVALVEHSMFTLKQEGKKDALATWLRGNPEALVVIFTKMKHTARRLGETLYADGIPATSLHGNLSQAKRQKALKGFKDGTYRVMIATDIASRGIDVEGVTHVLNYDMPDTLEAYIHRTGRAGRASREGKAVSFVTRADRSMIRSIEGWLKTPMIRLNEGADTPSESSLASNETSAERQSSTRRQPRAGRAPRREGRSGQRDGAERGPSRRRDSDSGRGGRDESRPRRSQGGARWGSDSRTSGSRERAEGPRRFDRRDDVSSGREERRPRRAFGETGSPRGPRAERDGGRFEDARGEGRSTPRGRGQRAERGVGRERFDRPRRPFAPGEGRSARGDRQRDGRSRDDKGFRGQQDIDTNASYVYQEGRSHFIERESAGSKDGSRAGRPRRGAPGSAPRRNGARPQGRTGRGRRP